MAQTKPAEAEPEAPTPEEAEPEVNQVEFMEAQETDVPAAEENLDLLLDVQMPLTVIMGETIMPFKKLLQLGPGSVIQLDKTVGQPADLYIQDIRFATADVVVVDGCFAVRIREILGIDQNELKLNKGS